MGYGGATVFAGEGQQVVEGDIRGVGNNVHPRYLWCLTGNDTLFMYLRSLKFDFIYLIYHDVMHCV